MWQSLCGYNLMIHLNINAEKDDCEVLSRKTGFLGLIDANLFADV